MGIFLATAFIILLTLGSIAYVAGHGSDGREPEKSPVFSLLPGDLKYESPSGNFKFYFPVTTSIVLSIVLTFLLGLFS